MPGPVYSLTFSPDGKLLLVGTDNILWIWEFPSFRLKEKLICDEDYQEDRDEDEEEYEEDEEKRISAIVMSPGCNYVAAVSIITEEIWIFDLNKSVLIYEADGASVSFSNEKPWVLINNDHSNVYIVNLQTGARIGSLNMQNDVCVFSPDGQKIAVAEDKKILLYDLVFKIGGQYVTDPQKVHELASSNNQIDGICFMQDFFLVSSPNGMVSQWDYYGNMLYEQTFIDGPIKNFCAIDNDIFGVSEKGKLHKSLMPNYRPSLVIYGYKKLTVVRGSNGRKRMLPDRDVYSAHYDKTGNRIKIVSKDRTFGDFSYFLKQSGVEINVYISIFDAATGSLLDERVDYEDKNSKVSTCNGIEEDLDSPCFFDDIVNDVYTLDKKYRASVEKNTVKVVAEATNKTILSFTASYSNIRLIEFSPNGKSIMTVSDDSVIRLWSFAPLQHFIKETKERFEARPLSKDEKIKYYIEFK